MIMKAECLCVCLALCVVIGKPSLCLSPDYGRFWHVTDFHYDHTYKTYQLSCNAHVANPAPLGDYWCDSPWKLVTATIDAMAKFTEDVDFVLWTGDSVAHISNDNLSEALNMDILKNVTQALASAFPHTPVFPAFGNHDYYPTSQFPSITNIIYNRTADMWKGWIQEEDQLANFRKGGYYTRMIQAPGSGELRMVVLNTNLYYTSDKVTPGMQDPSDQLRWLRSVLTLARSKDEKVILAAHIPPGVHTPRGVLWFQKDFVEPFNNILKDFTDVIKAMHFGHDHYDGFKVFYDHNGQAAIPLFVAPSVTPWRFKLSPENVGTPHNPAIRLVTYDRHTGHHLNIQQFRLDLSALSRQDVANFTLLYSFTQQYGVSDISASSLDKLVSRMASNTEGDALLDDYFRFTTAGATGDTSCDSTCKRKILCGFKYYTWADYLHCTTNTDISIETIIG